MDLCQFSIVCTAIALMDLLLSLESVTAEQDPCLNYKTLNDTRMMTSHVRPNSTPQCGTMLKRDWYRYTASQNGVLATSCPSVNQCSSTSQIWMNDTITLSTGISSVHLCVASLNTNKRRTCCELAQSVQVKVCGDFVVYLLSSPPPSPDCKSYCFNSSNVDLPTTAVTMPSSSVPTLSTKPTTRSTVSTSVGTTSAITTTSNTAYTSINTLSTKTTAQNTTPTSLNTFSTKVAIATTTATVLPSVQTSSKSTNSNALISTAIMVSKTTRQTVGTPNENITIVLPNNASKEACPKLFTPTFVVTEVFIEVFIILLVCILCLYRNRLLKKANKILNYFRYLRKHVNPKVHETQHMFQEMDTHQQMDNVAKAKFKVYTLEETVRDKNV